MTMLPRLAARVWRTMIRAVCFSVACPARLRRAKGTKVIRATSLVTHMLPKKQANTSTAPNCRVVDSRSRRWSRSRSKKPVSRRPPITPMRQNRSASTGRLRAPTRAREGGTAQKDSRAPREARKRMVLERIQGRRVWKKKFMRVVLSVFVHRESFIVSRCGGRMPRYPALNVWAP